MIRPWLIHQARNIIHSGGLVAYPTEAVFGIGADPDIPSAVERLLSLKRRKLHKGLILVAVGIEQVIHYIKVSDKIDWQAIESTWPGPVTWVFPASRRVPVWLRGAHSTIAIRVSDHPLVRALCAASGPIISTSANPESRRPAKTPIKVRSYFGNDLDLIIPGSVGGLHKPTEIRDAISGKIYRAGQFPEIQRPSRCRVTQSKT